MDNLATLAEKAVAEGVFPGCVIGTYRKGERRISRHGETHAIYDLASITKSIPVAMLAARFIQVGRFSLQDRARTFIPELHKDFDATIEDLLRYRVKGVRMSTLNFNTFEEVRTHALEAGFDGPPGRSVYTNLPAFVLGITLERVGGAQIATLAHHEIFEPLGMTETTFFPAHDRCAPTEIVAGEVIQGLPHDESARVFARARRSAGHAGLFSSVDDLLTCAAYLIEHLDSHEVQAALHGLGWQVGDALFMGEHASARMVGKTGFTGTSIIVDLEHQAALVILSNRTYPHRPLDDSAIYAFRRAAADTFFSPL